MNKIIIFGDSFEDPNYNKKKATAWYEMFKGYEVTNHCLAGTGPHYSIKNYYDFIENEPHKDEYIIIFLLSGEDRIAFPNADPQHISHINWDFVAEQSWFADNSKLVKEKEYYHKHRLEIDYVFKTMRDELLWSNYKNLSMLWMNSFLFNIKTITCFISYPHDCYGTTLKEISLLFRSRLALTDNDNFLLYPYSLSDVAEGEGQEETGMEEEVDDRRNHLSQYNHEILYNNLNAFLNRSNNFTDHITKVSNNDFIYE